MQARSFKFVGCQVIVMAKHPWNIREGFIFGSLLLASGVLLQFLVGPVVWQLLAWPVNVIMLAVLLVAVGVMYALRRRVPFFEWQMHNGAAVPALTYALGLTIIMGLILQTPMGGVPYLSRMLRLWPFVLAWGWVVVISGLAALNHLLRFKWREIPFVLNHLGVFVAIVAAALGSAGELAGAWLAAVYAGIIMMMAGAICLMLFMAPKPAKEEEDRK